ncbi:MAG: hypothetical protein JXP34_29075, partial [Planctomycetes bacterium]|nr:hypothetical protein [Planctomycetota bacterium]
MDAIFANGHTALVADRIATAGGALESDTIGEIASQGIVPASLVAESEAGDASGALRWHLRIAAGGEERLGFVCTVRAGRRAIGHRWAEAAIDYFLGHPFNGRVQPEADNPGQVLWAMGEHWRVTRDRAWLARVYPGARKIAAMILLLGALRAPRDGLRPIEYGAPPYPGLAFTRPHDLPFAPPRFPLNPDPSDPPP